MKSHILKVERSARLWTTGDETAKHKLIALHGYAQLAEYHIRHYKDLQDCHVICPEGLSRLYVSGMSGRVGASWMTKQDRQHEIVDQIDYLNRVQDQFGSATIISGFSQGCSTAWRWLMHGQCQSVRHVLLWAGEIPRDELTAEQIQRLAAMKIHYIYGTQDAFMDEASISARAAELRSLGLDIDIHVHDGEHKVVPALLSQLWTDMS